MKYLKIVSALIDGKKRAVGGLAYVLIDVLLALEQIDTGTSVQLKILAGGLFGAGVTHALVKRGK